MDDFLNKARSVFALPDNDIIEGAQEVKQAMPSATDDEVISHMVEFAKQKQPEVLKQALAPMPNQQDVSSLYEMAEERARQRRAKSRPTDVISLVGSLFAGKGSEEADAIGKKYASVRDEEREGVRKQLGQEAANRNAAIGQYRVAKEIVDQNAKQEQAMRENDPNSEESKRFQQIIKIHLKKDTNSSAAELKALFPHLTKIYLAEQAAKASAFKEAGKVAQKANEGAVKAEQKKKDDVKKELQQFYSGSAKDRDKLSALEGISGLLSQGDWSNAAQELSKTMMTRMAGDPRPSDADIKRISPNPGFAHTVQRAYDKLISNKPHQADANELRALTSVLQGRLYKNLYNQARGRGISRSKLIDGISDTQLATEFLSDIGLGHMDWAPYEKEYLVGGKKPAKGLKPIKELSDEELRKEIAARRAEGGK